MERLRQNRSECTQSEGFTLIELLIVILVLSVLMAIALPLYLASVAHSETTVCRSNMQSIANAEQAFRARDSQHLYTTTLADLPVDLGSIPVCPHGGTYSVTVSDGTEVAKNGQPVPPGLIVIHCTDSLHGDYAPSIDSD